MTETYPMISGRVWWELRKIFSKSVPTIVTIDYLVRELELPSGQGARSNIIAPLTQMGIIDEEGKPTKRAYEWRDDERYRIICESIIDEIYPEEIKKMLVSGIEKEEMKRWFKFNNEVGESSATKVVSTLMLLSGEVPTEKEIQKKIGQRKGRMIPREVTLKNIDSKNDEQMENETMHEPKDPVNGIQKIKQITININVNLSPDVSIDFLNKIIRELGG